jgi:hypothetical protein
MSLEAPSRIVGLSSIFTFLRRWLPSTLFISGDPLNSRIHSHVLCSSTGVGVSLLLDAYSSWTYTWITSAIFSEFLHLVSSSIRAPSSKPWHNESKLSARNTGVYIFGNLYNIQNNHLYLRSSLIAFIDSVEKPAETQTSIWLASHLVRPPNSW